MIVGVGIDLIETERVARALDRWGDRLVAKLMGEAEASRLPEGATDRARALALAIAAKEAASKALGTGWSAGVRWRDVELELGPPTLVRLHGRAAEVARYLGSSGRTWTALEARGNLVLAEVRLLSDQGPMSGRDRNQA